MVTILKFSKLIFLSDLHWENEAVCRAQSLDVHTELPASFSLFTVDPQISTLTFHSNNRCHSLPCGVLEKVRFRSSYPESKLRYRIYVRIYAMEESLCHRKCDMIADKIRCDQSRERPRRKENLSFLNKVPQFFVLYFTAYEF